MLVKLGCDVFTTGSDVEHLGEQFGVQKGAFSLVKLGAFKVRKQEQRPPWLT